MNIERFVFHTANTHPDNGKEFVRYEDVQKRIAELEALLRGELVEMDEAQSIEYLRGYAHGMANPR